MNRQPLNKGIKLFAMLTGTAQNARGPLCERKLF